MRLHPSLLMLGLLIWQAHAYAEGTGPAAPDGPPPAAKAPVAPAHRRRAARAPSPRSAIAIDAQVLAFVQQAYPLADMQPAAKREFKQRQIAQVLSVLKADTGSWYGVSFEPFLKQQGAGGAKAILDAIAESRSDTEIRAAALTVLTNALSQKNDAGQFVLPMPPTSGLLAGRKIPGRDAVAVPPAPANPAPADPQGGAVVTAPSGAAPIPVPSNTVEVVDRDGKPFNDEAEIEFARMLAKDEELRKMAAARLARFIWEDHAGLSFVAEELRQQAADAETVRKGTLPALLEWVTAQPGKAGLLVRFLGVPASERPAAAQKPEVAKHLDGAGAGMEQKLANALKRWTENSGKTIKVTVGGAPIDVKIKPLTIAEQAPWILGFMPEAHREAWILRYGQPLNVAIPNVERNGNDGDVVPGDKPIGGRKPGSTGPGFTRDELYGKSGELGVFTVGSKDCPDCAPRVLSVRLISESRSKDDPRLVDKLAIYDITSPKAPVYGTVFALNYSGKITLKSGGRDYNVGFDDGGLFTLKAGDGTAAQRTDGVGTMPTMSDFFKERALFAQTKASIVNIGNREFYVWGQGTRDGGANVYLPKRQLDQSLRDGGDLTTISPSAMAYVNECIDGVDRIKADPAGNAKLIGADGKSDFAVGGQAYHLKWNGKAFTVTKGAGPVDAPPPSTGTGTSTGTGRGSGTGTTSGGGADAGQLDADGFPTYANPQDPSKPPRYERNPAKPLDDYPNIDVASINKKLKENGVDNAAVFQINFDGTRPPTDQETAKYKQDGLVIGKVKGIPINQYYAIVFKGDGGGESAIPWDPSWKQLVGLRVLGSALVTESDKGLRYIDMSTGLTADKSFDEIARFDNDAALNNGAIKSTKGNNGATGLLVLGDILKKVGFTRADEIVGKVTQIYQNGLPKGDKLGSDTLPVAIPAGKPYQVQSTGARGKDGTLIMVFTDAADLPVLRLSPTFGVHGGGRPALPGEQTSTGGNNTFSFRSEVQDADDLNNLWGNPRDIGAEKGGVLLDKGAPVAGKAAFAAQPGAHLYRTDATDKDENGKSVPVKRYYLVYSITQDGAPTLLSAPALMFQSPSFTKSPRGAAPPDLGAVGLAGVELPKGAAKIVVGNLLSGERLEDYRRDPSKGIYYASDAPAGKSPHCVGVVLWWGVSKDEANTAAVKAGCPALK